MASGSEVSLIVKAGELLSNQGISVRLVSFPSWEVFKEQDGRYQEEVLPTNIKLRLAIEAGVGQGWHQWVGSYGRVISLERFGASAPAHLNFQKFGFTVENVVKQALELVQ